MSQKKPDKQQEIYDFIKSQVHSKGYPPSVREICSAVGLSSTSTVHGHLSRLEKKGLIKRDPTKPRAIEVIGDNFSQEREIVNIPILGNITAGSPILAVENMEGSFPLPLEYLSSNKDLFMLKVSGESMIEAGIMDGDLAIIEKTPYALNGEIVVALIDDSATLKRFFKEKDYFRLQPENSSMNPIIINECEILGKLIGLFRQY